jgi:hypothetical protein
MKIDTFSEFFPIGTTGNWILYRKQIVPEE